MNVKKITVAGLLASGLVLAPPVYAQENGEIENAYQTTIADNAFAVPGDVTVTPGSTSKLKMVIKQFDSEKRIDPTKSTIDFGAEVEGWSVDIDGRDVTLKVGKHAKPYSLSKVAKITYTFEDGSKTETTLHISVAGDNSEVEFNDVESGEIVSKVDDNPSRPNDEQQETYQSTIADKADVAWGHVRVMPGSTNKFTMVVKEYGSEKRIEPKTSTIDFGAEVKGWSVDIDGRDVTLKVDRNAKPYDLSKNAKITYTFEDGSKKEATLNIFVVSDKNEVSFDGVENGDTTSDGVEQPRPNDEPGHGTERQDSVAPPASPRLNNPDNSLAAEKNKESLGAEEVTGTSPESSTNSSRTVLASTGASVGVFGLLGLLILAVGTLPLLRNRR